MWSFLKNHHYVWETGLSGHLTYGPLGKRIKNNLEDKIRREFQFYDFEEIETPLIFRKDIWIQSGHWERFQDPIIKTKSGKCYRVDKLIEENYPDLNYRDLKEEEILKLLSSLNQNETFTKDPLMMEEHIQYQSLMMKTTSGHEESGLRPETATATYFHSRELAEANHHQWPIKVFQIGRSFRNEINPKHNLIRGREFTQAEFQVILPEELKANSLDDKLALNINLYNSTTGETTIINTNNLPSTPCYRSLIALTYATFLKLGLNSENIRLRQHGPTEMAFYALDAYDIEIKLKELGWTEIAGLHDRGGYDLRQLENPPHILEVAIGIDRLVYAILDNLYEEKAVSEGKSMLKLPYYLAPIQISVLPLMKNKEPLVLKAREVYLNLKRHFITEYNEKSSIGKRYLKNAQRGIPYSITIDFDTLDDNTVTVRDRDTEAQIRVATDQLVPVLFQKLYQF